METFNTTTIIKTLLTTEILSVIHLKITIISKKLRNVRETSLQTLQLTSNQGPKKFHTRKTKNTMF